ncbi:MAG: hypothetical protein IPN68_10885 [Bacteroidetes bacterium]|nr:hypothetical protein [Bacteroidota bacterium]
MNYQNLKHLIILFTIIISASSCNLLVRDHSLKPDDYIKLGMPDNNKVWTNDDYVAVNITLSSLKMNDPLSLPRKNSRKSGEVFQRLVSPENLNFIYDTVFPLRTKAYFIQYYPRFQTEIEQMYTIDYKGKPYYSEELIDLHIFGLHIQDRMLELGWIIDRSEDPETEGLKGGMQSVQYNYLRLIPRLLDELLESESYTPDGLERLSLAIAESLTRNKEWMNRENKDYLLTSLKSTAEKSKTGAIKENLGKCIEILQSR